MLFKGCVSCFAEFAFCCFVNRSSKSALHGLIHWLSQAYGSKGITVNGVAPALIGGTKMLPGNPEELAKSRWRCICIRFSWRESDVASGFLDWLMFLGRDSDWCAGDSGGGC